MSTCHLDVESFSTADLRAVGAYKYAEDETTEVLVVGYAFDNEPVQLWLPYEEYPKAILDEVRRRKPTVEIQVQSDVPARLRRHIESDGELRMHNAAFERAVLNGAAGRKLKFPKIKLENVTCTAAKCAVHGLPRALGDAAKALGSHAKDDAGRMDMLALAKPRSGKESRWTPHNAPERFINMLVYNCADVEAERGIDHLIPDLSPSEQEVYRFDGRMNDLGVLVDIESVHSVKPLIEQYKAELAAKCMEITGIEPTKRAKLADWIRLNGFPQLQDMQAQTVKDIVASDECPDNVKTVLKIYSTYNAKAVAKYDTLIDMACGDNKLRGQFLYHGAATGRWSSTGVQLQNVARGVLEDPDNAIEAYKAKDLNWIRCLYSDVDPMKVFASTIRGMLIASPGKDLLFPDFAGIESRVNAWLWDEQWKLEGFRKQDAGTGPDNYKVAFSRAFNIPIDQVQKWQRQIGKVMELALGYEGGVGAFSTMVQTYGIKLPDLADQVFDTLPHEILEKAAWMWKNFGSRSDLPERIYMSCDGLKQLWRDQHKGIVRGWKDLREAAVMAVRQKGDVYQCADGKIMFKVVEYKGNEWLCMRLPSGRRLWYFHPSLDEEVNEDMGTVNYVVRYWGVDTYSRRYMKTSTYGGKLDENAVQAISRDLLVHAKLNFENQGYPAIGSVHDEPILEPDEGFGSLEEAAKIMCDVPRWAAGLPVAVEGHRAKRYRK